MEEGNNLEDAPDYANFVPKKATRKIERKMLPMMRKMDAEELMESNNFKRFSRTIEAIFDQVEEVNMAELGEQEEDTAIPSELLVPKYQASELASEAAKLKSLQVWKSQIKSEEIFANKSCRRWSRCPSTGSSNCSTSSAGTSRTVAT